MANIIEITTEIPEPFEMMFIPKRNKIWKGGRGGAKSESIGRGLIEIADMPLDQKQEVGLLFPESVRILCLREIQNSISESSKKLLEDIIEGFKYKNFRIYKDAIENKKTGSDFIFKGLKTNTDSIKSMKGVHIAWVEEAHKVSKESWTILKPTIREPNSEIWVSYNPDEDEDPVAIEFQEDEDTYIRHVNYDENPFFPEVLEKERLACFKYKPDDYGNVWEGKTKTSGNGLVVKNFTDENIKNINYHPDLDLHITADFNVQPMMWCLAHISKNPKTDEKEKVFFFDEIVINDTTTSKTIDEFYNKMCEYGNGKPNLEQQIIINGDASGSNRSTQSEYANFIIMQNRLSSLGFKNVKIEKRDSNGLIKRRVAAWNEKVVDLNGNRCIIIDPRCKWLIYNMRKLKYKEGTSEIDIPTSSQIKKNNDLRYLSHIFDSASYLVNTYWPIKREY